MKVLIIETTPFAWYHDQVGEKLEVEDDIIEFFGKEIYREVGTDRIIKITHALTNFQLRERKMKRITEK